MSRQSVKTHPSPTRMLTGALVATLVAAVGVSAAGAWAVADSLERAAEIARREEQTAYLVGSVARDVSRIRAGLLESMPDTPSGNVGLERVRMIMMQARLALEALPPLLGPEELAIWRDVEPPLDRLLHHYDDVVVELSHGHHEAAQRMLDGSADDVVDVDERIDRFQRISLRETEMAIANVDDRTAHTLELVSLVKIGLLAVMVFAWILVLRIVASQRRALAVQIERLETSNRDLEAFAGRVAHDMRNVLAPIQLGTSAIEARSADAGLREIAARIDRSCARGRELVDGLLTFSRAADPGDTAQEPRAVVARELEDVLDQLDATLRAADVRVTTNIPSDAEVTLPGPLLHAVLLNLADNAIKFMRGRAQRRLTFEARCSAKTVTVSVRDTGPGIPDRDLARVFDALYRGSGASDEGAGLGLATVKRIVESHGGCIRIGATGPGGTTFVVELPRAQTSTTRAEPAG